MIWYFFYTKMCPFILCTIDCISIDESRNGRTHWCIVTVCTYTDCCTAAVKIICESINIVYPLSLAALRRSQRNTLQGFSAHTIRHQPHSHTHDARMQAFVLK